MANINQMQAIASHKMANVELDGNGICFSLIFLQIIYIFEFLAMPICLN
jgi:hypothetical protein